ncbi:MAG TPA: YciI family protein [Gemmatimonadaceae bacterium]|nr:YciI family protein [Gemmatimonadaceae bacterium]
MAIISKTLETIGDSMRQYLLSIYQPDGPIPAPAVLERVMRELDVINQDMKTAGAWVFTGGLHDANTATVAKLMNDEVLMTDGPFAEGREHIGGIYVINAPDLDAALGWAGRIARATTLPIEVRPFQRVKM